MRLAVTGIVGLFAAGCLALSACVVEDRDAALGSGNEQPVAAGSAAAGTETITIAVTGMT